MSHKNTQKVIVLSAIGFICIAVTAFAYMYFVGTHSSSKDSVPATVQKPPEETINDIYLTAMGDMLAHDSIVNSVRTPTGNNFSSYFESVRTLQGPADIRFCNPETTIAGDQLGVSGYPTFNAPSAFATSLVNDAKCNLITLATNHINDKGQAGIDISRDLWEKQSILGLHGANRNTTEQREPAYFTLEGIRFAFVAFADYSNNKGLTPHGLNTYHDSSLVNDLFAKARMNADFIIVSAHWGTEDSTQINEDQRMAAQMFSDQGADLVIGTGPHVIQPVTYLQSKDGAPTLVWYSIGNMLSAQLQPNQLTGIIAGLTIRKNDDGSIRMLNPTAQIMFMSYDWPAPDRASQRLDTRTNFKLRTLAQAGNAPALMFGNSYTPEERIQFVRQSLGTDVEVEIKP